MAFLGDIGKAFGSPAFIFREAGQTSRDFLAEATSSEKGGQRLEQSAPILIGGALGFAVGGPQGALIGAQIGAGVSSQRSRGISAVTFAPGTTIAASPGPFPGGGGPIAFRPFTFQQGGRNPAWRSSGILGGFSREDFLSSAKPQGQWVVSGRSVRRS